MTFILQQSELINALNIASKALGSGFVIATTCFRFHDNSITACNMEISISCRIDLPDIDILIPGEQIKNLIASLPDQPIIFDIDGIDIKIKTSSGVYEMVGETGEDFPTIKTVSESEITLPFEDLTEALFRTSYTKLNDSTANVLNAVQVKFSKDKTSFAAFNGVSFALFNLKATGDGELLLPSGIISALSNIQLSGECIVNYSKNSITIKHGDVTLKSILLDGLYLDWANVLKIPTSYCQIERKSLISAIKRVLMFSNRVSNDISISVSDKVVIKGEDIDLKNKAEETIASSGDEIVIGLNGMFLIESLNKLQSDVVYMYYSTFSQPALFRENLDDPNFCLLAPIVIKAR